MPDRETRNISLSPELDTFIARQVESGRYTSASEVVRAGLRLLERDEQSRLFEKVVLGQATDDDTARLPPELLSRVHQHVRRLVAEAEADLAAGRTRDGAEVINDLRARSQGDNTADRRASA
ncbi:MAG: type II toxin-antitoxin system ParD family antitoxin [Phycisphaerae bacterium]|nr:type II toxin-antitoxin system ParD family antitoxin [Phycisphaerae bacterium]